jgi:hypothetical protein
MSPFVSPTLLDVCAIAPARPLARSPARPLARPLAHSPARRAQRTALARRQASTSHCNRC